MKSQKLKIFQTLLEKYGQGTYLLDIATGHGKYAIIADKMGYTVTAFDARPDRIPTDYPMVKWEISNLKDFYYKGYDTILCLGILYHLPIEEQESLLRKINYCRVILDTHIMPSPLLPGPVIKQGEYEGGIHIEAALVEDLKFRPMAAFDELSAFWHTPSSLMKLFYNCGFKHPVEMVKTMPDRSFYILEPACS